MLNLRSYPQCCLRVTTLPDDTFRFKALKLEFSGNILLAGIDTIKMKTLTKKRKSKSYMNFLSGIKMQVFNNKVI